ncbi:hypothetical protein [Variovorax sp. TBS-050B]|uniref:hypothetical protein n=1 Tax=Variovorax sp. TBS-050B TaxID=2940551 RepID=UPI0024754326|nr:hypothetical protein [Variovorax sp. TBS-050B]
MTTATPPAPSSSPPSARILFFSSPLLRQLPRAHAAARLSTWPFRVAADKGSKKLQPCDLRVEAARVIRTTAMQWWPPAE